MAMLAAGCSSTAEPTMELAQVSDAGAPAADLQLAEEAGGIAGANAVQAKVAQENTSKDKTAGTQQATKQAADAPVVEAAATASATQEQAAATTAPQEKKAETSKTATSKTAELPPSPSGQVLENGGPILTAGTMPAVPIEPKKKSFLSSFFGSTPAEAQAAAPAREAKAKPVIALPDPQDETRKKAAAVRFAALGADDDGIDDGAGDFSLPGVRKTNLFEIKRKSGIDDDSDIDVYEDEGGPVRLASAGGMARLAPNGLLKQRESVDTACLKPKLVRMLKDVERRFGKRLVVTSGYRSPSYNKRVRGAEKSQHMYCAAVDVQMPGVNKWEIARYVRSMPGRGGVGTYCHDSIHIDIGPERDWNWKCGGRKT